MEDATERRWALLFVYNMIALLLLTIFLWWLVMAYFRAFEQSQPWDGEFTCEPGETYTVAECP